MPERQEPIAERLIHPHIVRLLDFALLEDMAYLVMEYASGASLRQRHPRGTPVDLSTVVPYCQQIATALRYMHDHQLIHRDLKPENLLLGATGQILLADFGLATLKRHSMQYAPTLAAQGTLAYMAPEQFRGKPTASSDQYVLGVCVYEWLTGTLPEPPGGEERVVLVIKPQRTTQMGHEMKNRNEENREYGTARLASRVHAAALICVKTAAILSLGPLKEEDYMWLLKARIGADRSGVCGIWMPASAFMTEARFLLLSVRGRC